MLIHTISSFDSALFYPLSSSFNLTSRVYLSYSMAHLTRAYNKWWLVIKQPFCLVYSENISLWKDSGESTRALLLAYNSRFCRIVMQWLQWLLSGLNLEKSLYCNSTTQKPETITNCCLYIFVVLVFSFLRIAVIQNIQMKGETVLIFVLKFCINCIKWINEKF